MIEAETVKVSVYRNVRKINGSSKKTKGQKTEKCASEINLRPKNSLTEREKCNKKVITL